VAEGDVNAARFKPYRPLRRKVAIRSDGEDFVIAFQPEDIVVFRHAEATALRRACVALRWEVVSDTVAEAAELKSCHGFRGPGNVARRRNPTLTWLNR
jgi:hypothetical protein